MSIFTARYRIDLIKFPLTYTALKNHYVAVICINNNVIICRAVIQEFIHGTDMHCSILITPFKISITIQIIVVIINTCHSIQMIYVVIQKYLLDPDVISIAKTNEFIGIQKLPEHKVSAESTREHLGVISHPVLIRIACITPSIEIFNKCFIALIKCTVFIGKIEMKQNRTGSRKSALKTPRQFQFFLFIGVILTGNYRI